jgi:hypothetical protein
MGDIHILQGTLNKHLGLLEHASLDFMEDAQILTLSVLNFNVAMSCSYDQRQGSGTLLALFGSSQLI